MKPKRKMVVMRPHYSGGLSKKFWKKINSLRGNKHDLFYTAGVLLQDIEGSVLRLLNNDLTTPNRRDR